MPRHLIGDAHEWINEIPTVPIHFLAKLQPSQRSWVNVLMYILNTYNIILIKKSSAGQEDPFELDSNLLLSSGRHGEDCKRQYYLFTINIDHETPLLIDLADLLY